MYADEKIFGGYRTVWILVLFDLPTDTKSARRQYTHFRKALLADSFTMMQYSVYMRHCASDENAVLHIKRVKCSLPPNGEVRVIKITDQQFAKIEVYFGKKRRQIEKPPTQLEFL